MVLSTVFLHGFCGLWARIFPYDVVNTTGPPVVLMCLSCHYEPLTSRAPFFTLHSCSQVDTPLETLLGPRRRQFSEGILLRMGAGCICYLLSKVYAWWPIAKTRTLLPRPAYDLPTCSRTRGSRDVHRLFFRTDNGWSIPNDPPPTPPGLHLLRSLPGLSVPCAWTTRRTKNTEACGTRDYTPMKYGTTPQRLLFPRSDSECGWVLTELQNVSALFSPRHPCSGKLSKEGVFLLSLHTSLIPADLTDYASKRESASGTSSRYKNQSSTYSKIASRTFSTSPTMLAAPSCSASKLCLHPRFNNGAASGKGRSNRLGISGRHIVCVIQECPLQW